MRHQQSVAHESNMRRFLDDLDQVLGVHQRLAQADRAVIGEDGLSIGIESGRPDRRAKGTPFASMSARR